MKPIAAILALALLSAPALADDPLPSDRPDHFNVHTDSFDYVRRIVMIRMRDGVKLHTVILIPKGAHRAPMLLTRTPYDADELTSYGDTAKLVGALDGYDNADDAIVAAGYIRVVQDVRGKYHSEGGYVMNRPIRGPLNPSQVDHPTDTYDTIDWLVKNVPESNGRVGTIGISYDGFTTLMSLVDPHPALKVAVPMNPMVDGWVGDDWYHKGAFRQLGSINYIYEQEATRSNDEKFWTDHYDDYDTFLGAGPGDAVAREHGDDQLGFYRKIREHTAYDEFWQLQAVDKILAKQRLTVPTMLVHSLWDQEDIYGALAVYRALKAADPTNPNLYLAMGPWHHGQAIGDGSTLGPLHFGLDTSLWWRMHVLRPFLDHYLRDDAPPMDVARVTAFETGTNEWQRLPTWPACGDDCTIAAQKLYLKPAHGLGFDPAPEADPGFVAYVSDPEKPIPFVQRPIHMLADGEGPQWKNWLVSDQREASTRPDVLTFETDRLTAPLKLAGAPIANLVAATTGTAGDFVVKLIDVYPDVVAQTPAMGGYQLMISADILRGRYRQSFSAPEPIPANVKQTYRFDLPTVNHVFLPGHRIMVQVQSTWFPLYDLNPQSYVENIFDAKPSDYQAATISVYDTGTEGSFVELPVAK
ncbi:MAG TPA: CocE/NonD family hydrolase [Acetobacteraceae bacterium]|nr:CocE/NonD family hydrolase [Acetobacteraceae bacterium]